MTLSIEKLKNIDLEKLYHFYLIFRERSIKKVSDHYHISTSTLRHSLTTLETKLDLKIYRPSKKMFIPTDEGKNLFELCRNLIEVLNTYQNEIDKDKALETKKDLIILTTTTFANYYLPVILKKYNEFYPDLQIQVHSGSEYLNTSDYAFDVIIAPKINNVNLVIHKLDKFIYKFYCSPELKKKIGNIKSPSELKNQNLLLYSGQHLLDDNIIKNNKIKVVSNPYPFLLNLCSQGLGIISCFNIKVLNSLRLGIDIEELFSDYVTEMDYGYFYHHRLTDKADMIERLYSITYNYLKNIGD